MNTFWQALSRLYRLFLHRPALTLMAVLLVGLGAAFFARDFSFDASEDTLVAEGDPDLAYYRAISDTFATKEYLFLTYTSASTTIFNKEIIDEIDQLSTALEEVNGVAEVFSILDAPLFQNPPVSLMEVSDNLKTLRSSATNLELAERELTSSPLFREFLISTDGHTTALRIELRQNPRLARLAKQRSTLRSLDNPTEEEQVQLAQTEEQYSKERQRSLQRRDATLDTIRSIRDRLDDDVAAYLGGVPLIASDMVEYVKHDIAVFGLAVFVLTAVMLFIIFRQWRWVLLPIAGSALSILLTIGLLGALKQPTTVISSNFISLIAIITISLTIHLIVRFRELKVRHPHSSHFELVYRTMVDKFAPCAYTALTTMVAFASLITSEIVPVMDFGWIMCVGIILSFVVTYVFFASLLLLVPEGNDAIRFSNAPLLTRFLGMLSTRHTAVILCVAAASCIVSVFGITRVSLDNRFIDYFRSGTEVHKGLSYIDTFLGGTIPLDIILHFPAYADPAGESGSDFFSDSQDSYPERYWFTPNKFIQLEKIHQFLENTPEIGKIISVATLKKLGKVINEGEPLDSLELMGALGALPGDVRQEIIAPYASPGDGLLRLSARVHETGAGVSHRQLLDEIDTFIATELDMDKDKVRVTGMEVLFTGMLEHLFDSQKSTLIFVIAATFLMFTILLRSFTLALIGLLPNIMSASVILAFMGFVGIPLDIMTITIAAIIIGVGVDDAIHYLHRFKQEVIEVKEVKTAIVNSHSSIGSALYYTTVTVVIGFSVMGFSNFVPTVYFGVLTSLAMIGALFANLMVLPSLLVVLCRKRCIAGLVKRKKAPIVV